MGVRIQLIDIVQSSSGGSREDVAVATSDSSTTLRETVSSVLGHKFLTTLAPLNVNLDALVAQHDGQPHRRAEGGVALTANPGITTEESSSPSNGSSSSSSLSTSSKFCITGLISKNPQGPALPRTVNYFCINGRPVELPSLNTVLKKVWQAFGGKKRPSCLLHLRIPNNLFDVNLAPDKRQVLLTIEHEICEALSEHVTKYWSSQTTNGGVFPAHESNDKLLRSIAKAAVEESESELATGDDQAEPQRHKRRNAFVHDLSKAKMQHEHEQRVRRSPVPPKRSPPAAVVTADAGSPPSSSQESPKEASDDNVENANDKEEESGNFSRRQNKRGRMSSATTETSTTGDEEVDNSNATTEASQSNVAKDDGRVSDRDRLQWTAVQQRFNRSTNGSSNGVHHELDNVVLQSNEQSASSARRSGTTPVTPDETFTQHSTRSLSESAAMARVPILSHKNPSASAGSENDAGGRTRRPDGRNRPTAASLDQFSYRPNGSSTQRSGLNDGLKHPNGNNDSRNADSKESQMSADEASTDHENSSAVEDTSALDGDGNRDNRSQRPKRRLDTNQLDLESRKRRTSETDDVDSTISPTTETSIMDTQDDSSTSKNSESPPKDPKGNVSPTSPTVVWRAFSGTEEVLHASFVERHKMRERTNILKEIEKLKRKRHSDTGENEGDGLGSPTAVGESVGLDNSDKVIAPSAESVLSLSKEEFRQDMQVIGQFNLGFILARCRKNHIWILDQHACDEKYNFENLCRTTVLHEQRLLAPMALELTSAEEACILDHMDVFKANGFGFRFDPEAQVRHRLSLTALPHSGARDGRNAVQFGKDDVSALCAILLEGSSYDAGDGGTGTDGSGKYGNNAVRRYASMSTTQSSQRDAQQPNNKGDTADRILARLPKAIAMFASRACRTSIMIGTA